MNFSESIGQFLMINFLFPIHMDDGELKFDGTQKEAFVGLDKFYIDLLDTVSKI